MSARLSRVRPFVTAWALAAALALLSVATVLASSETVYPH